MASSTSPTTTDVTRRDTAVVRALASLLAAIVLVAAVGVAAPVLGLLAVPFVIGVTTLGRERGWPLVLLTVFALLHVVAGTSFLMANGLDAGWSDLAFSLGGTPVAALVAIMSVRMLVRRRAG